MEPAQASVEPISAEADAAAAHGYIPIDIGDAIPAEHKYERISIRVEGMRRGATLSRGRDNGDETWILTPEDLSDLAYIPSNQGVEPHTVCFRIVGVKGGFGEAIATVDVDIDPAAVVPGAHHALAAGNAAGNFAGMAARFQTEVDAEVARRIASEKSKWEKTAQKRPAEQAKAESVGNDVDSARAAELEMLVANAEERIQEAEEAAQEANEALGQALARAEAAEAEAARFGMNKEAEELREQLMSARRELSSVRASMRVRSGNLEEIQKEVHDALQDEFANQLEELHERYGHELERLTKLANFSGAMETVTDGGDPVDIDATVAAARRDWERDMEVKLTGVESATKRAIIQNREAAVAEARRQWEQETQEKLAVARADLDRRLEEERASWQAAAQERLAAAQSEWEAAEQKRLAAAEAEWLAAQPEPSGGVDENEVAQRIEAAEQEWQAAQNAFIESRDQQWQAELDRRIDEERAAWQAAEQERVAAQVAMTASGVMNGDPEPVAAAQEEWAQAQTLEMERRLLQAEEAWQANDEERLQAAKAAWEADQQLLIAERDERWKLELIRQIEEAKHAWRMGAEDHTPELEMPVVIAAADAPVGVTVDDASTVDESDGRMEAPDDKLPSFFKEHAADAMPEAAPGRESANEPGPRESDASAAVVEPDAADGIIPEWMEKWADNLRIPPHWAPAIHRLGRRSGRVGRFVISSLLRFVVRVGRFAFSKSGAFIASRASSPPPANPNQPTPANAMPDPSSLRAGTPGPSPLSLVISRFGRGMSKLLRIVLKMVRVVTAKLFRVAVTAAVVVGLYHGYHFAKPHVYPHVKPYITKYWDPHVEPYVRVYWDPYVQPYIDTYWGAYAKPMIVNAWDDYVEPPFEAIWDFTKSLASDAWDGITGVMPELPPPPNVGASVSQGAAKAKGAVDRAKPSAIAPRVYLRPEAANLRSGPSKYAALVGTVRQDDHIQRLEQNGGWIRIRVVADRMKVGWVHGALLSDTPAP